MSFRVAPEDARRGGLVVLGANGGDRARLGRLYSEGGYETVVAEDGDDPVWLASALAPPVFALAFPKAAMDAWALPGVAAASIVADDRVASLVDRAPASPAILHLDPATHDRLAAAFEAAQPDLPVHRLDPSPDGERLLFLRTLRLFSANTGVRGEV